MTEHAQIELKSQVADLLLELEKTLREQDIWGDSTPDFQAMMSEQPFACDVMDLQDWLQWIYIPKMKALIESESDLPNHSNIAAYAEEVWKQTSFNASLVMQVIRKLDQAIDVG